VGEDRVEWPANDAEVVPERVLHDGPLQERVAIRSVEVWRPDEDATDRLDLFNRARDVVDPKVEVTVMWPYSVVIPMMPSTSTKMAADPADA
jgi:hypothetical protein